MKRIAVLCASYNRVAITMRGLTLLRAGLARALDWEASIFLLDDASPDQTGRLVQEAFPDITVVTGTGNLFWNRGMCEAYRAARRAGNFDAYILFNDDVIIDVDRMAEMFESFAAENRPVAFVGPFASPETGEVIYSGFRRLSPWRPLALERIPPNGTVQNCDTFNGNFVLISGPLLEQLGGLDPRYFHSLGDLDLGYRVEKFAPGSIKLWREPIGRCKGHATLEEDMRRVGIRQRWRYLFSPQHGMVQHMTFITRHAPLAMWPVLFAKQYIKRMQMVLFS